LKQVMPCEHNAQYTVELAYSSKR